MKKLVLWSSRSGVSEIKKKIALLKYDIEITGLWIDNEELLKNGSIEEIPLYSYNNIIVKKKEGKRDGVLLSALKASYIVGDTVFDRAASLKSKGVNNIYIIPATLEIMPEYEMTQEDKENFIVELEKFSEPLVIKFLASEKCNLNCSGCTHFAPLIDSPKTLTVEECRKDLQQLKQIFKYIKIIQFLGGEPLLNRELPELIEEVYKFFPYASINVITNGLLIPNVEHRLIDAMKKYNVHLQISLYPPTVKIKDQICKTLDEDHISYSLFGEIKEFRRQYNTLGNKNMEENFYKCPDKVCHTVVNGKLGNCYYAATAAHANQYFGINIPYENSVYDLYNNHYTGAELLRKINSPSPMCSYCNSFPSPISPWKRVGKQAQLEDWFWNDEEV